MFITMTRSALLLAAVAFGLVGCDSSTAPAGDQARVSVAFSATPGGLTASRIPDQALRPSQNAARALDLTGLNGTLTLDEVWMIVAEFELERENGNDCFESLDDDECEKFEAPPRFISLPLDGGSQPIVSQDVPPGVYDELEFEVEDLEIDDDDDGRNAAAIQALFATIQTQFPDWPEKASMLVNGSFTPTGGTAVPFSVFFEAEIEIEIEFEPPLDLTAGELATATVVVDPTLWFSLADGTVMDLSQFQGQLVEFEAELEDGFTELEFDDDDS